MKQCGMPLLTGRWRLVATLAILALLASINWLQHQIARTHAGPAADPSTAPALVTAGATVAIAQASTWPVPDAEVEALVRQAVQDAGGLTRERIRPGSTVVVKPNLMWDADPDQGSTTDPRVVRAVVRLAREA